ncbi:hypothetical protein BDV93DRAFT_510387 [Ceratobasidium sp. AG-I]|nr:hypothetical protein BDV93DRAFT_510387 [Ceratobasidium sp. AG-I]
MCDILLEELHGQLLGCYLYQSDGWFTRPDEPAAENLPGLQATELNQDAIMGPPGFPNEQNPFARQPTYYAAAPINSEYVKAASRQLNLDNTSRNTTTQGLAAPTPQVPTHVPSALQVPLPPTPPAVLQPPLPAASRIASHFSYYMDPSVYPPPPPGFNKPKVRRKRKRARGDEPSSESEQESQAPNTPLEVDRSRPNLLAAPTASMAQAAAQSAISRLADPRPANSGPPPAPNDAPADSAYQPHTATGTPQEARPREEEMPGPNETSNDAEDEAVRSLYEDTPEGPQADLIIGAQEDLAKNVEQIDVRTRNWGTNNPKHTPGRDDTFASPPKPPNPVNWDQTISFDMPAGRKRRAKRHVLLMGLIRETIFKLLSRRSVHDPLPAPPPPSLRAPSIHNFGVRWNESEKSIFNRLATNIVAQKITYDQPGMLTTQEMEDLIPMVNRHIKYLCRTYKSQIREDAEEFNARRLERCSAGTRKRQVISTPLSLLHALTDYKLFQTWLHVIDRFPTHLGKHRKLIVHLGVDGTSSDEEEPKGSGIYKIKTKKQLSSKVTLLKRDLDHVYELYFKGPGAKGSQVHRRLPSNTESARAFMIQGLPLTCISRAWYEKLDSAEKEFYRFQPHQYDYSFPVSLFDIRNLSREERVRDLHLKLANLGLHSQFGYPLSFAVVTSGHDGRRAPIIHMKRTSRLRASGLKAHENISKYEIFREAENIERSV